MPVFEFELLAGSHIDQSGKEYRHDPKARTPTIIRSEDRLDLQFANKFHLRGSDEQLSAPEDNFFRLQPAKPVLPPPTQGGDFIIKEDHAELAPPPVAKQPVIDRGTDVTEDYPQAALHGLRVFRRKGRLCLAHESNLNETVMAKGGYVGEAQLNKAIDKYSSEHVNI